MIINPQPHYIRKLVARTFAELGVTIRSPSDLEETILDDESDRSGRSYRHGGDLAMWLVEVGTLQFYDAEGRMLRTINLLEEPQGIKSVA
jgi:hypothetical protein